MFTPFILFLGLTMATAVIAYWSDNLGKKLGKKRVSWLGMRPRTTATVLTVVSSWGIMLFTLIALLLAYAPLRNALFRYDREREQNRQLQASTQLLRAQSEKARTQASRAEKRLVGAQYQLSGAQSNLFQTQMQLKSTELQRKKAESARQAAQNRAQIARKNQLKAQKSEQSAKRGEAVAKRGEVVAKRGEAIAERQTRVVQSDLAASLSNLNGSRLQLGQIRTRLSLTQTRFRLIDSRLKNANSRYQKANAKLDRVNVSLKTASQSLFKASIIAFDVGKEVLGLERQRAALQKEISDLSLTALYYRDAANQLAGGDVKITVGRTFAARIIAANSSATSVEALLRALFQQGQRDFEAEQQKELGKEPGGASGARLQLMSLPEKSGETITFIEGDAIFERLAREVASSGETTSVRLVAARNFLAGEKEIVVRFVAVPVARAFRADEKLASATIDGTWGDARIFNALLNLTDEGRQEAAKRGVNPPQSPDEPNFYATGTNVSLFEALRQIEASGTMRRVELIAAQELSTVEPLRVRFRVLSNSDA